MESLVVSVAGLDGVTTVVVSVKVIFGWQERRYGSAARPMADRRGYRPEMAARRVIVCGLGL